MKLEANRQNSEARCAAEVACTSVNSLSEGVGRILGAADAAARFGVSFSTLKRGWPAGKFPAPVRVSENRIGWLEVEIDRWQRERIAERDASLAARQGPEAGYMKSL